MTLSRLLSRSLLSVLLASAFAVPQTAHARAAADVTEMVVMGDSFSAGNGAANYYGPHGCWRSHANWAELYAGWMRQNGYPVNLTNVACNGATTKEITQRNRRPDDDVIVQGRCYSTPRSPDEYVEDKCFSYLRPQVEALNTNTDLVVLTMGGNDVGFSKVVHQCFVPAERDPGDCRRAVTQGRDKIKDAGSDGLRARVAGALIAIRSKAPRAHIVLLGYPHLVGSYSYVLKSLRGTDSYDAGADIREMNVLGTAAQKAAVDDAVRSAGGLITYVDSMARRFEGHEPEARATRTNSTRWLLEVGDALAALDTTYHPNPRGHAAYSQALQDIVGLPASVPTPRPIPNAAPSAAFSHSRLTGAGNLITLDGSASRDPDGSVVSWRWSIGGETIATGIKPTVALGKRTNPAVTLTVTDQFGKAGSITKTLSLPNRPPSISRTAPADGVVVGSNTPVLAASGSDPDGDTLQFSYRVVGPSTDIDSGWVGDNWTVPAHRLDPGVGYRWTVTIRDAAGMTASRTSSFTVAMLPTAADVVPTSTGRGYWQVDTYGGVFSYGDASFHGALPGKVKVNNILGMARTPDNGGYWLVGRDGGVFAFGNAPFVGSLPGLGVRVNNIVGMAPTRTGKGYWLVGSDGGVFAFGDAPFHGSMGGKPLNKPVTALAASPTGNGYWLAAKDGGIFAFGDAPFFGSMGDKPLNAPVTDMDPAPDGKGYWMTAEDGGVFAFGSARFFGSLAGKPLNGHISGMAATPTGDGYWLNGCDGGVFAFGKAEFRGSNPTYQCRGN
ncbi:PKD domain-containing protein [Actinoplanes sp. NPDC004185]